MSHPAPAQSTRSSLELQSLSKISPSFVKLFDFLVRHLLGFADLRIAFGVELQCEKKTRLRAARSASNPAGISLEDRGIGAGPVTDLQDVTEWLGRAAGTALVPGRSCQLPRPP